MKPRRTLTLAATVSALALAAALGTAAFGTGVARADDEAQAVSVVRDPAEVPAPIARRAPETVKVDLKTVEVMGNLADGTTFRYWTFNGKVPGPMVRVRVGDTVEVSLTNDENSWMNHNI